MLIVTDLAIKLGQNAESLVQDTQSTLDRGAATLYEAKISQGLRKVGLASKINHFADAATVFKSEASVAASKVVHPALLEAALQVSRASTAKGAKASAAPEAPKA